MMASITKAELDRICRGIREDRDVLIRHNPIGTDDEILLWSLMGCLISYLSVPEDQVPCFPGRPDAATYRRAILYILEGRREGAFDPEPAIDAMLEVSST